MEKYIKKVLSLIICSFMLISPLNLSIFAQEEVPVENTENLEENLTDEGTFVNEEPTEEVTSEQEETVTSQESINEVVNEEETVSEDAKKEENAEEPQKEILDGEKTKVNYFYVGVPYLETPAEE